MPYNIPKSQGKIAPAGTHVARLVQVIDLGTQASANFEPSRKIRFSWELPLELDVFNEDKGEQPYMVHKDYTLSFNEKSNLRKDLQSWRGRPFTEEELAVFDETKVLGKPCMVTILHTEKGTKTYANVASVSNIPKGTQVPEQINASIAYNTEKGDDINYRALPEWLQKKIAESPEFQAATSTEPPQEKGKSYAETVADDEDGQDIPF